MAERLVPSRTAFGRVWQWMKDQIVQDVPAGLAVCEFGCRREQCTVSQWQACDLIAGENAIEFVQLSELLQ
ncbi:MAG: hypothetical protein PVS2B2_15360 [Candidatus Acidiferrum sp.]